MNIGHYRSEKQRSYQTFMLVSSAASISMCADSTQGELNTWLYDNNLLEQAHLETTSICYCSGPTSADRQTPPTDDHQLWPSNWRQLWSCSTGLDGVCDHWWGSYSSWWAYYGMMVLDSQWVFSLVSLLYGGWVGGWEDSKEEYLY